MEPTDRKLLSRALRTLIGAAVLAALAWYIWHARRDLSAALRIDLRYLIPLAAVPLASLAANGLVGRDLAAALGVKLTPIEWYGLAVMNSLGNYLPLPQGGAVARGVYLKRVHNLPYTAYAASLLVTYICAIALYGILGLAGLTILAAIGRPTPPLLWIIFAALAASLIVLTPLGRRFVAPARIDQGLQVLTRRHLLAKIVLLQAILVALTTTGLWLGCKSIPAGRDISWPTAAMLGLIVLASGIANVTPGNIGVEQFAAEATARLLRVTANVGLLGSAIFRAVSVLVVLAISPLFATLFARHRIPKPLPAPSPGTPGEGWGAGR
jgi:hypothetical protein